MSLERVHSPVLVKEVFEALELTRFAHLNRPARLIDATLGTGGHALVAVKAGIDVLGIDIDPVMLKVAQKRLKEVLPTTNPKTLGSFKLVLGNFRKLDEIAAANGFGVVEAIIFDLGVSNVHFKADPRGFSFEDPSARLDMRLDPKNQAVTARDLLNGLRHDQLKSLFESTMEKGVAAEIARRVEKERSSKPFEKVGDFLEVFGGLKERKLHPATRAFLALRTAVNSERENLVEALPKAFGLLNLSARLAVISFHSGEDRIVKDFFRSIEGRVLTPTPITPSQEEIFENPRARSARLRIIEKI